MAEFFLSDRFRSQAALVQVSSTLLNSDSRTRVKCKITFCVSLWQITSHNDTPLCHDDKHLKRIENSGAAVTQMAKNFHPKRFCTSGRNIPFVVFLWFLFFMIVRRKWYLILAMFEKVIHGDLILAIFEKMCHSYNLFSVSCRQELQKSFLVSHFTTAMFRSLSVVYQEKEYFKTNKFICNSLHFWVNE